MAHVLDPLPYPFDALEPALDARTLEIHHDKHHAAYVNNLNKALEPHPDLQKLSLVELISDLARVPEGIRATVRNNGGGHFAHNLYWRTMKTGGGGQPAGELGTAIASSFGSFADFKAKLTQAAIGQFGSGWAWLYLKDGKLQVTGTPGHDCPEMTGGKSLLVVDVWEHAYYLKYQNRRADYVEAWWGLVAWGRVADALR
jgi:Fe-Mn family superoxide dismutase